MFGCAYERIADEGCSDTTLRRRRDEWIALGAMDELRELALKAYDRFVGLELSDMAVDRCITKAPCGGEKAGRSPVDRGKRGIKRSIAVDAGGIPVGFVTAPANRDDSPLFWPKRSTRRQERREGCPRLLASTWTAATTRRPPAGACESAGLWPRSPRRASRPR